MTDYIAPELGTIKVTILDSNLVIVQKFKHNTLRGDSYWVAVKGLCKQFKTKEAAENYAERVRQQET